MTDTDTDTNIETAQLVIPLNDRIRELFKLMSFPEMPEEAQAIAFFADGQATFLSDAPANFMGPGEPFVAMIMARLNVDIDMSEPE